jgi:pilus assembly protein TadC
VRWRLLRRRTGPDARDAPAPDQVASALVLLALAYRAGLPTAGALEAVAAQSPEPVARDLRQVAAALHWGAGERESWRSVGPAWAPAGRAVVLAQLAGLAPGPLLLRAADDLWAARVEQVDIAAAKVGVRLVAPLGLVLLPAFCLTTVVPLVVALARQLLAGP